MHLDALVAICQLATCVVDAAGVWLSECRGCVRRQAHEALASIYCDTVIRSWHGISASSHPTNEAQE